MSLEIINRSKLQLVDIEYDYRTDAKDSEKDYYGDNVGKYPLVYYKGLSIESDDILYLTLTNDDFLPKLEMKFNDKSNKLFGDIYPLDNDLISIFIRAQNESSMPVRMDFKITVFNPTKPVGKENQKLIYYLEGELNVDTLYNTEFRSDKGTSYSILKKISEESQLGFATNIDGTQDEMTWLNPADYTMYYMKEITIKSFKNDSSFLSSYIDFYYNFCFVNVEIELKADISTVQNVGNESAYTTSSTKEEDNITKLKLTNHPDYNDTNTYIDKFNLLDEKTSFHLKEGYSRYIRWYDKLKNSYKFFHLKVIKENDKDKYSQLSPVSGRYLGKLDIDNMHENYLFADQQNSYNMLMLQKTNMLITLTRPNFSLNRFQKVLLELYSLGQLDDVGFNQDAVTTEKNPKVDDAKINKRLSGEWIIIGISYTFSKKDGNVQEITLAKRSLNEEYTPNTSKK